MSVEGGVLDGDCRRGFDGAEGGNETRLWPCRTLWDFYSLGDGARTFKALEAVEANAASRPRGHALPKSHFHFSLFLTWETPQQ